VQITGAAEGYVANGICDFCVCIVFSGKTIAQNNLKVLATLYESKPDIHIRKDRYDEITKLMN